MNATDPHDDDDELPTGDMDEAQCLFVLSLLLDGRAVEPERAAAARAFAASHPQCEQTLDDWKAQAAELAAVPALRARGDFTERVLAAASAAGVGASARGGDSGSETGELLRFARRLAVAAGLALALTLGYDLLHPGTLRADSAVQRHRHAVDHFKATPFGPDDIATGLRARLHDVEFGALGAPGSGDGR